MSYNEVEHGFVGFKKMHVAKNEVLLRFEDPLAAEAFKEWWRVYYGDEHFADWCEQKDKYRHLVEVIDD